jgi:hypothetical protein
MGLSWQQGPLSPGLGLRSPEMARASAVKPRPWPSLAATSQPPVDMSAARQEHHPELRPCPGTNQEIRQAA